MKEHTRNVLVGLFMIGAIGCLIVLILLFSDAPILAQESYSIEFVYPDGAPGGAVAAALAVTQAVRVAGWHHKGVWRIPILWVLYCGFGGLVLVAVITPL